MSNPLFEAPTKKVDVIEPKTEPTPEKTHVESEPSGFQDNSDNLLNDFDEPTEVPEDHFAAEPEVIEPEEDEETETADDGEVGLDAESLDIISEAIIQSNDQAAKWLINYLNGPDVAPFLGAGADKLQTLQKAWRGILLRIKYKPSGWDALLAAEFSAYGWHLMAAMFSFVGRWFKGLVRLPWQAAKAVKKAVTPERETTVESEKVVLDSADFVGKTSEPHKTTSQETVHAEPVKICLETNKPFRGIGAPKTSAKHPELIDKFKDMGAFRAYCNRHGLSGSNAKKNE